jgi:hypothetical protein
MKISFIGKFKNFHDEEYIAQSFELLGHEVQRVHESYLTSDIYEAIDRFNPDIVLWTKLMVAEPGKVREHMKKYKTVCWVFDLYWGYEREFRLTTHPAFTADYVFTTDGGHEEDFKRVKINHKCVRQGIFHTECTLVPGTPKDMVIFVGSDNAMNSPRQKQLAFIEDTYGDKFKWYGRLDTNEVRGMQLNQLYADNKIVVGDSVYSPNYWSNRVVETLGRGGFLIHREVPGLKEEYPYLVTYNGELGDLKEKIDYYLAHEDERVNIVNKNIEWVKERYTMDKKCKELLNYIS